MRHRLALVAALAAAVVPAVPVATAASSAAHGMSPVVSARLLGAREVPKASPSASGLVVLHVDGAAGSVCWSFSKLLGIGRPTAAHIHRAPAGHAGPVVVPLGASFRAKGCAHASAAVLGALEEHPGAYYVNVHTARYPNGAARGNLAAGMHG